MREVGDLVQRRAVGRRRCRSIVDRRGANVEVVARVANEVEVGEVEAVAVRIDRPVSIQVITGQIDVVEPTALIRRREILTREPLVLPALRVRPGS